MHQLSLHVIGLSNARLNHMAAIATGDYLREILDECWRRMRLEVNYKEEARTT